MRVGDTQRLRFTLITESDADFLFQLDQDPEVMKYINGGKPTTRDDLNKIYLPRLASYTRADRGWGMWRVDVKEDASPIGWVLVRPMDFFSEQPQFDNLELGWRFMRSSWGQGYATEAAQAVMSAVSAQPKVAKVTAIALEGNDASIGVMRKLGMAYVKTALHKDPLGDAEVVYYERSFRG